MNKFKAGLRYREPNLHKGKGRGSLPKSLKILLCLRKRKTLAASQNFLMDVLFLIEMPQYFSHLPG